MSDLLSPFSPAALAKLPKKPRRPSRYTRADEIPDVEPAEEDGEMPSVRDYHSISAAPPHVRVPKKTPTPVRVEGKVWFANERSMCYCFFSVFGEGDSLAASLDAIQTLTDSKNFQPGSRISICLS